MIFAARTIAAAGLSILSGTAYAQDDMNAVIDALKLPMDNKSVTHFNNATKVAVTEKCFRQDANTVACNLRVMANEALLDSTYQGIVYQVKGGKLSVSMGSLDQGQWTSNKYSSTFKPAAQQNNHGEWAADAPLAQGTPEGILQNDVRKVTYNSDYSATICSMLPISENRGVELCTTFGDATVQSKAAVKVFHNGAVVSAEGLPASRAFDQTSLDQRYMEKYVKQANGGTTFTVAGPYKPN